MLKAIFERRLILLMMLNTFYAMTILFFWCFWPRPFPAIHTRRANIVSWPPFNLETYPTHQNVRNGHVYISVVNHYMLQNAYISRYSRKTVFCQPHIEKNTAILMIWRVS